MKNLRGENQSWKMIEGESLKACIFRLNEIMTYLQAFHVGFFFLKREGTGILLCLWAYAAWWQVNTAHWTVTLSACLITPRHIPEGSLSPHSGFSYACCLNVSFPFFFFLFSPFSRILSNRSESAQIRPHSLCNWMFVTWFGSSQCDLLRDMGWLLLRYKVHVSEEEGVRVEKRQKETVKEKKSTKEGEVANEDLYQMWPKPLI